MSGKDNKDEKNQTIQPDNAHIQMTSDQVSITEYLDIPSWEREKTIDYYKRANDSPLYEVSGYHGVSISGGHQDNLYTIHFINKNLDKTVVRLSIHGRDLQRTLVALNSLLEKKHGR